MKFWKKTVLFLLCAFFAAQIPFIYRRIQTGRLAGKISALEQQRTAAQANPAYNEFKGVIHVHTSLGGHSTGNFDELIEGARKNALDFVLMTEHASALYDTAGMTLRGFNEGVLFVGGNEMDTENQDRFLLFPGSAQAEKMTRASTRDFLSIMHSQKKIAFVAYPEQFKSWDAPFDGIEVFNMHTGAKQLNAPLFLLDALWSYGAYPELTLANHLKRPDENLKKFDEISKTRKITLTAGNDAHSNIGFHLLGDDAGNKLFEIKLDDYETIFRVVRMHALIEKEKALSEETLLEALKNGRAFIAFDALSDAGGFSFTAENGAQKAVLGDELAFAENQTEIIVSSPLAARFVIFRNGEKFFESAQIKEARIQVKEKGSYRAEVYLDSLGSPFDKMPWIISNPIYIK